MNTEQKEQLIKKFEAQIEWCHREAARARSVQDWQSWLSYESRADGIIWAKYQVLFLSCL